MNPIYNIYDLIKGLYNNRFSVIMTLLILLITMGVGLYVCNSVLMNQSLSINSTFGAELYNETRTYVI